MRSSARGPQVLRQWRADARGDGGADDVSELEPDAISHKVKESRAGRCEADDG